MPEAEFGGMPGGEFGGEFGGMPPPDYGGGGMIDPMTGQPMGGQPMIDPMTGQPMGGQPMIDPMTGQPMIDPNTGMPMMDTGGGQPMIDPMTGQPMIDPNTGMPMMAPGGGGAAAGRVTLICRAVSLTAIDSGANTALAFALESALRSSDLFDPQATSLQGQIGADEADGTYTFGVNLVLKNPLEL
jgi:hypothetical protein